MFANPALAIALFSSPTYQPPPLAVAGEYLTHDGHRVRWASVTYALPDGQTAEAVLTVDDTQHGDGYLMVEGETIVHASYDDANGITTWGAPAPGTEALANAALVGLSSGAADELLDAFTGGSQEFPCSKFGKGVLRVGKYIWVGMVAASGAICCGAGVSCPACLAGGAVLAEAGREALEGYCD